MVAPPDRILLSPRPPPSDGGYGVGSGCEPLAAPAGGDHLGRPEFARGLSLQPLREVIRSKCTSAQGAAYIRSVGCGGQWQRRQLDCGLRQ
eukprot:884726-Pyramimonas_sp.AAC.1